MQHEAETLWGSLPMAFMHSLNPLTINTPNTEPFYTYHGGQYWGRLHLSRHPLPASRPSQKPGAQRGTPVVPFYPFDFGVPLLKLTSRKRVSSLLRGYWGTYQPKGSGSVGEVPRKPWECEEGLRNFRDY